MMFRLLLRNQSSHSHFSYLLPSIPTTNPKTLTLTLILTHSYSTTSPPPRYPSNNKHKGKRTKTEPPSLNQSVLDAAISQLPSRFTPSDLTSLLSRQHNPYLCFHIFNWATHQPRFRPDPSTFLIAIKKLGTARLFTELQSIASLALSTLPPSQPLFNTLIYFFAEARSLSKAIYVYNRMRDAPDLSSRPNLHTYNLLFNALLGRGANSYIHHVYMDTVRSLFRQMVSSGVKPDVVTLNFVVKGYVQSLHLNDALRVFHQFGPVYGCEQDENTYSYLVHGLCAQGRTRNARELYGEMREKGMVVSMRAGNSLVSALAMGGEVEEAVMVLWEVVEMGQLVEFITCRTLVEEICRKGRLQEAVGLASELREREVVDGRVHRELINGIEDGYDGRQWNR